MLVETDLEPPKCNLSVLKSEMNEIDQVAGEYLLDPTNEHNQYCNAESDTAVRFNATEMKWELGTETKPGEWSRLFETPSSKCT